MDKKFQVFISSTYDDLIEERQKVMLAVLRTHNFPVGMEIFGAESKTQWETITKTIDTSDYYILLIKQRYGHYFPRKKVSYTEEEYRYAQSKGIPILAFIANESIKVEANQMESEQDKIERLRKFKDKVKKAGRNVAFWSNSDELASLVSIAIQNEIKNNDRPGWIRECGMFPTYESITTEKTLLKERLDLAKSSIFISGHSLISTSSVDLEDYAAKGIDIRLLMTKPSAGLLHMCTQLTNITEEELSSHIETTVKRIPTLISKAIKHRCIDAVMPQAYVGIDIDEPNGCIYVQQYLYAEFAANNPNFVLTPHDKWYKVYREQIEKLWDDGEDI